MSNIIDLFAKGGAVMGVIFCVSIYVTAVILFKFYQFYRLQALNPQFVEQLENATDRQTLRQRLMNANLTHNPVARVMLSALKAMDRARMHDKASLDLVREEISRVGTAEIRHLEAHLRGLDMAANVAPLLGLLGTVIGMVQTFSTIEQAGSRVDPSILAGGIWTALLTTVAGLAVAIPSLAAYYFFDEQIEKVRMAMKDVSVRLLFTCETGIGKSDVASFASVEPMPRLQRQVVNP